MKVLIVGLGLMGGAYAYKLKSKGYKVYGTDINKKSIEYAIFNGFIDDGSVKPELFIQKSDIIIIALYPNLIVDFVKKYSKLFNENQIITDISGVKTSFVNEVEKLALPASYVSHHPMAGREKSGVNYSKEVEFNDANFLITTTNNSKSYAVEILKAMGKDLGFGRINVIDIEKHDAMIGFTSQLTHAIAVSLVNSDKDKDTKYFIGDSYRDLTRIAKINEVLWTELFLENKDNLLNSIESFENELNVLKQAIKDDDREKLKELFVNSTKVRKGMDK